MDSSSHRVHGLADDLAAPDWPALTGAELVPLLARYPQLGGLQQILWHSPRPLSAAALICTENGAKVFVKRHAARVRSIADLEEEHRLIAHLRGHGLPLPALYCDSEGASAVAQGDWTYELHAKAQGVDRYRDSRSWTPLERLDHARAAGALLARLHRAAADYHAPQRHTYLLIARGELIAASDPIAYLQAQLPQRPALAAYLAQRSWRDELAAVFAPWQANLPARIAAQPACWTHNDWHASNLCWSRRRDSAHIRAILDFGLAARSFALYDLATAIERNAIAWLHLDQGAAAVHTDTALTLLQGYAEVTPLDGVQRALLADLLPLVHVDFALSEVEYFAGVTRSPAAAKVAYDTFLRGHAEWFQGAYGQALLTALRTSG